MNISCLFACNRESEPETVSSVNAYSLMAAIMAAGFHLDFRHAAAANMYPPPFPQVS